VRVFVPADAAHAVRSLGPVLLVDDIVEEVSFDATIDHRCDVMLDPVRDRILAAEAREAIAAHL
jgi:hypothetical protein